MAIENISRYRAILIKVAKQSFVPFVISFAYTVLKLSGLPFNFFSFTSNLLLSYFFCMWFVSLWVRNEKLVCDDEKHSQLIDAIRKLEDLFPGSKGKGKSNFAFSDSDYFACGYDKATIDAKLRYFNDVIMSAGHSVSSSLKIGSSVSSGLIFEFNVFKHLFLRSIRESNNSSSRFGFPSPFSEVGYLVKYICHYMPFRMSEKSDANINIVMMNCITANYFAIMCIEGFGYKFDKSNMNSTSYYNILSGGDVSADLLALYYFEKSSKA